MSKNNGTQVYRSYTTSSQHCQVCDKKIKTMCFIGTGVCCELCRKQRDREGIQEPESRLPG